MAGFGAGAPRPRGDRAQRRTRSNGHAYVAGQSTDGSQDQLTLFAYDARGARLWVTRSDDDPEHVPQTTARALALDVFGAPHVAIAQAYRSTYDAEPTIELAVKKYDVTGRVLWTATFADEARNVPTAMVVHPEGHVTVAGYAGSQAPDSYLTAQLDTEGQLRWADRDSWTPPASTRRARSRSMAPAMPTSPVRHMARMGPQATARLHTTRAVACSFESSTAIRRVMGVFAAAMAIDGSGALTSWGVSYRPRVRSSACSDRRADAGICFSSRRRLGPGPPCAPPPGATGVPASTTLPVVPPPSPVVAPASSEGVGGGACDTTVPFACTVNERVPWGVRGSGPPGSTTMVSLPFEAVAPAA